MPSADPEGARGTTDETRPEKTLVSVPAAVYRIALVLIAWFLLVEAVAYSRGAYEPVVVGVCLVFTLVAFGLPSLIGAFRRPGAARRHPPGLRAWLRRRVQTASGPLEGGAALVQILLIPVSVALGFTAISLVEMLLP